MAQVSFFTSEPSSLNYQQSDIMNPSSEPNKPISDHQTINSIPQDQLHSLPSWQDLEQNFDWRLHYKRLDFTFNSKDLAVANKFASMLRERKVYHQPYDICPIRKRKSSRVSYSKSCEPRWASPKDESSQTDFDPNYMGIKYLKPPDHGYTNHLRRSSSLTNKNPYLNVQTDFYDADAYSHNYSVKNSNLSSARKDYSPYLPNNHYQNLAIPSAKNEPDSVYKDIGAYSKIDHSNMSTRDSVGLQSRFLKGKHHLNNYDSQRKDDNSFDLNEGPLSYRSPKILILDGRGPYGPDDYSEIRNDFRNSQRDTVYSNLDYLHSERSRRKASDEYKSNQDRDGIALSDNGRSDEEQSSDDQQKFISDKNIRKEKKVQVQKKADGKGKNVSNPKFKFIGDIKGNREHIQEIPSIHKDEDLEQKPYSNKNIIDINKLLAPQLMDALYQNSEIIIIEGELNKYKPGVHFNYVKRWVQITKNELRYYESRLRANAWESTPILIIPFKDIRAVYRVNIKLPKNIKQEATSKGVQKIEPKLYHFEVFTHNHPLPSLEELDASVHTNASVLHDRSLLFSPDHAFNERQPNKSRFSKNVTDPRSGYLENTHLMPPPPSKKQEERNTPYSSIPENCDYEEYTGNSNLLSGSLMNPKLSLIQSKHKGIGPSSSRIKNKNDQSFASSAYKQGVVRKNQTQASQISEDKDKSTLTNKDPKATYHYVKTIEDLASWSGRHKEWYYSEKRLLFCSISYKEREIWLSVINWLIKVSMGES